MMYPALFALIAAMMFNQAVYAQHLDIEVWGEGNALFTGYCRTPGVVGCDLGRLAQTLQLPPGTLPIEAATGRLIFLSDFRDFSGGDFRTRNPGFQSVRNALLPNELLSYRALGVLKYWDPASSSWGRPPEGSQIRLFGGLEASSQVISDYAQCAGQLFCFSDGSFGTDGNTVFAADGIHGNPELVVDITNNNGVLHTHLSFFLEDQQGEIGGPVGAYLIEMQVISNARYFPSEPFLILFNAGLNENELASALLALIGEPTDPVSPLPPPVIPVSIPGDVDLDGDVDRIDVALILLAVQNNEPLRPDTARFDVNGDGVIDRADAFLAKELCTLRLCYSPTDAPATALNMATVYDEHTGILSLNDIQVNDQHYRAQLQLQDEAIFVLNTVQPDRSRYAAPAHYHIENGILEIPSVYAHGKFYQAILLNIGDSKFRLEHLEETDLVFE
jgi:hypothetical protein